MKIFIKIGIGVSLLLNGLVIGATSYVWLNSEKRFNEILSDKKLMEKILKKMEEENSRFNISSTPTFVINDKHVIAGSLKYKEFVKKLKDFELLN